MGEDSGSEARSSSVEAMPGLNKGGCSNKRREKERKKIEVKRTNRS